jgi:hypothetical protein
MMSDPIHQFEIHDLLPLVKIGAKEISLTYSAIYMMVSVVLIVVFMIGATAAFALYRDTFVDSMMFHFARLLAYNAINIYAAKVAGAFMISTSTLLIYTNLAPRWIALVGYAFAVLLLFGGYYAGWVFVLFPIWILVLSVYILVENPE